MRPIQPLVLAASLCLAIACLPLSTSAATVELNGTVQLENKAAVGGAIVSVTDAASVTTSVYSDASGHWRLRAANVALPVTVRVRAGAAYADWQKPVTDPAATSGPMDVTLRRLTSDKEISERLTASAHAAAIRWQSAGTQQDFRSQCMFCHQFGNDWTRKVKTVDEWRSTIRRMEGYGALITWQNEKDFAASLNTSFTGQPLKAVQTLEMHAELPKATMREWSFGGGMDYVHDIEQGPDGKLYGVDMSNDKIWILDPRTNQIEAFQMPANGLPLGGKMSGAVAPLGTFNSYHGPHSIVLGPDNKFYITCSLSAEIAIFDPVARRVEFVPIGWKHIYPHTLRFDHKGTLWFTTALSNGVGKMDIKTRQIQVIDLPSNGFWRWLTDKMMPSVLTVSSWFGKKDLQLTLSHHQVSGQGRHILNLPYGLDVNPIDGSIWYSKLYAGYIGRVDPQTGAVKEFKTPHAGPRRLRFDRSGNLWIPSFEDGVLMKFDPKTESFTGNYPLPVLAKGEFENPYALAIHPVTQEVWIAANLSDRFLRFNPKTATFSAYHSPTRVTFVRDFIFLPDGQVCTSNSNLPAASIEGGRPRFMCLDPAGKP